MTACLLGRSTGAALTVSRSLSSFRALCGLPTCPARHYSSGSGAGQGSSGAREPTTIRNFAIIAHIDHGKTTLMDRLLAATGHATGEERAMDSNTLEKERGITILAKVTSFPWAGHHLNAVDTPGHADFGGEVERVLGLVDGCVLLVDAAEGPLAQTKFVVGKALERGLRPIVLLNKVDRPAATRERCAAVVNHIFDLFASLGANDDQLDFPLLYASAKQGWAAPSLPSSSSSSAAPSHSPSMAPLLDLIVRHVPPPPSARAEQPFAMGVTWVERDPYIGRIVTGRVASGRVRLGDKVHVLSHEAGGPVGEEARVTRITQRAGMAKVNLEEAVAGDIVSVAGAAAAAIGDTVAAPTVTTPLDPGRIDPPTLAMVFGPNDSPLAGRAGKALTGRAIGERLQAEADTSVSLRVRPVDGSTERYEVQARGELQLGVLIEGMRREGAELAVSPPQVLLRRDEDSGQVLEPLEEVMLEVADEVAGAVIEAVSLRRGELTDMTPLGDTGKQRLTFIAPSRGLIGFKSVFVHLTRGEGIMSRQFLRYGTHKGALDGVRKGVMVSLAEGRATTYALGELQSRGTFFVTPGTDVYAGMVVGEHNRDEDLDVNPCKEKKASNVRTVMADDKIALGAPRLMSLEDAIGYVAADELIEVTPAAVRIRKEILDAGARRTRAKKQQQQQQQQQ